MQPTVLKFEICGFFREMHQVEWRQDRLQYQPFAAGFVKQPGKVASPGPAAGAEFWRAMDDCGVWQWQARYFDNAIDDGTQWSLKLEYGGRRLESTGSNEFPGGKGVHYGHNSSFGKFLKALEHLTGVKGIR